MTLTDEQREFLRQLATDDELMELGRKAIEDELVDMRDRGMWLGLRNNGFVIKHADGEDCGIIRFGPEVGVRIALKAIAKEAQ